jgi:hypothetical protein
MLKYQTKADLNLAVSKGMSRHQWDFDLLHSAASFEVHAKTSCIRAPANP